jgi:hypothetical protein
MIRAEVRSLHSPDVHDLSTFVPDDPDRFGFLLQIIAGPTGEPGEESFDVMVCTPGWLAEHLGSQDVMIGRHYLFVGQYDFARQSRFIAGYAAICAGETWAQVARQLGRLGRWEFEDYRESDEG